MTNEDIQRLAEISEKLTKCKKLLDEPEKLNCANVNIFVKRGSHFMNNVPDISFIIKEECLIEFIKRNIEIFTQEYETLMNKLKNA